ncbi:GNAT family N-acetyltransferase [Candidatus Neptunichlamydia sp. REUL1]|uniref:GNAT family N-acetyltransferase n=1 Tax=Candidatus Neptunichlamydia sp. REUL1 TaxID=3064277 RepID=UPI00292D05E1|nr:GNAT family N-acetyltransferase [Candidatus Neptunochlamydia sp. REUL1]
MKWIFYLSFICSALSAWSFEDEQVGTYSFQWDHKEDFHLIDDLFIQSFKYAYDSFIPGELGLESVETFLQGVIADEQELWNNERESIHWLIIKNTEEVIGLLILELKEFPKVYVRQMAISPNYMRLGIGRMAANIVLKNLPGVERIVAVTRVLNKTSQCFLEELGFIPTEDIHDGFDSNKYVGYELIFK